jgi:hypothetical protein
MNLKYPSIIIFAYALLVFFSNCATKHSNDTNKIKAIIMSDSIQETKNIKVSETFEIKLQARGALGLKLMYRTSVNNIVDIKRQEIKKDNINDTIEGDGIHIIYLITGLMEGNTKITFYETQPWNKEFKEIIQKEIQVNVNKL